MYKVAFIILILQSLLLASDKDIIKKANELFDKANKMALKDPDKSKKMYVSAALKYQSVVDSGVNNAQLLKNLGNAYFSAGDKGRALLNFHRAHRLSPSDTDILHSINFLRTENVDEPPESTEELVIKYVFFWHHISFAWRLCLFTLLNIITWSCLVPLLTRKTKRLKRAFSGAAVLSILLGGSLLVTTLQLDNNVDGVIIEREVTPRQGNGYIYEMALTGTLHSGTEFEILETRKDWYYIKLPGGSQCWIPSRAATKIN